MSSLLRKKHWSHFSLPPHGMTVSSYVATVPPYKCIVAGVKKLCFLLDPLKTSWTHLEDVCQQVTKSKWWIKTINSLNPFATENVDIRFEGLALTPDVRKNTFFSKKPSQTKKNVTSVIFMVEWKVNQFWNAQDFADSKLVSFSFYHKKYGSCDYFNKTSCFKKRIFTYV